MEKLEQLINGCKAFVAIEVNEHRNYYEPAEQFLIDREADEDIDDKEIYKKMIELDTIVMVQFYPDTPIGFYRVWHYDADAAIDKAVEILNEVKKERVK
jgi:hypothetical protein